MIVILIYEIERKCINAVDTKNVNINVIKEHCGFCVAFNRNIFHKIPVYESFITGGDTQLVMYLKTNGNISHEQINKYKMFINYIPDAIYPIEKHIFSYNSCDLDIYHLNHGSLVNRKYHDIKSLIFEYFEKHNINEISDFLYRREDGILEILDKYRPSANDILINYFIKRDEDESI